MTYLFSNWKFPNFDPVSLTLGLSLTPPLSSTNLFSVSLSLVFCFLIPHEIICYLSFLWLSSLGIMPSSSIHVVADGKISFFFRPNDIPYSIYVCVCVYLQVSVSFSSDKYTEVALLDHIVVLFLVFWGTSVLFCIMAASICIPTNNTQRFPFVFSLSFW